ANIDDGIDRLNRYYTCCILLAATTIVSLKQYAGSPIDCWCPGNFAPSHVDYANSICWVNGTYFAPFEEAIPRDIKLRSFVLYYQWIPFLLVGQAVTFFSPYILWQFCLKNLGINLFAIVNVKDDNFDYHRSEKERSTAASYCKQIVGYLKRCYRWLVRCSRCFIINPLSDKLSFLYLTTKLIYLCNVMLNIVIVDSLLVKKLFSSTFSNHSKINFNINEFSDVFQLDPSRFPKVTLCDFLIRQQINVHRYTVQCVLPINLINEKVFIFLLAWFFFLFSLTTTNFLNWLARLWFVFCQANSIHQRLKSADRFNNLSRQMTSKFVRDYLKRDGLLVMDLISLNANDQDLVTEILFHLW
ncbi:hypothetical protein HELRODRAFT_132793, partial [Helobdella robusta]|uniref:Innexin n=1 Tax=Helobdella robusta TaxID=6412 RepID=T1EHZ5_HELRO